jgi:hypothetical protein
MLARKTDQDGTAFTDIELQVGKESGLAALEQAPELGGGLLSVVRRKKRTPCYGPKRTSMEA